MKLVCFSEIQWRYVQTRKQQILTRLPGDWEILFLSSVVRGRRNNLLPERDGRVVHLCVPVFKNVPQAWLRRLFSVPPVRFAWNVLLYLWLRAVFALTGFGGRDRVFWVSNVYYAALLPLLGRRLLFYDCNHDPLAFPDTPAWAGGYFRRLAGDADLVTAVTGGLADRLRDAGAAEVAVVGNGVDADLFERAAAGGPPPEMRDLPKPVIGYVGAIADWFDFTLVEEIAARWPDGTVALVGPVFRAAAARADELARRPNVRLFGARPYEELGAWESAMDVCLVPLVPNELRRLADPNKIYEYAAAGRPIVTYDYSPETRALGDLVYRADTREAFVRQVERALGETIDGEKLRAFARSRSWQARAGEIEALIREALERKESGR